VEKWKLLEYFSSVPDDSQPRRCIDNPELTYVSKYVVNPAAVVLWLVTLWLKYKELIPEVREQLETITNEVTQGRRADLDMYLESVMGLELRKAKDMLNQYNMWSTDHAAITLRTKTDNLQQARVSLVALKRDEV